MNKLMKSSFEVRAIVPPSMHLSIPFFQLYLLVTMGMSFYALESSLPICRMWSFCQVFCSHVHVFCHEPFSFIVVAVKLHINIEYNAIGETFQKHNLEDPGVA